MPIRHVLSARLSHLWDTRSPRVRRFSWSVPAVCFLLVVFLDGLTTGSFRIITWIVVVPGMAAALCGVWTTALFAALATLAYLSTNVSWPSQYRTGWPDFFLVAGGGALAVASCALRLRSGRYVTHLQDAAEVTRSTVLRPLPPYWAGMEMKAIYLAADSTARVGGDFYDVQPSRHGARVIVGDVQGKGLSAVAAAAGLLGAFREWCYHEPDLARAARGLETSMRRYQAYSTIMRLSGEEDRFATAVLVNLPGTGGDVLAPATFGRPLPAGPGDTYEIEVVDFGHEPPLAVGPRGARELTAAPNLPLGLSSLGEAPFTVRNFRIATDETLLFITDGVTEARDAEGTFFPLAAHVSAEVRADTRLTDPARLADLVRRDVLRHTGGELTDDTTIFALRRAIRQPRDAAAEDSAATARGESGGR